MEGRHARAKYAAAEKGLGTEGQSKHGGDEGGSMEGRVSRRRAEAKLEQKMVEEAIDERVELMRERTWQAEVDLRQGKQKKVKIKSGNDILNKYIDQSV